MGIRAWAGWSVALLLCGVSLPALAGGPDELAGIYEAREYKGEDGGTLLYRLLKPKEYDPKKLYPLVLCLHGSGGRGDDNVKNLKGSKAAEVFAGEAMRRKYPCFVVVPQCPGSKRWVGVPWSKGSYSQEKIALTPELKRVIELLARLRDEFSVDPGRLYVTGQSMGGYGTWDIVLREPTLFAAAIPCCGGGDPSRAHKIVQMGIWAFHGARDRTVPVRGSREMIDALKEAGGSPRYSEFEGAGHTSWNRAYATEGLWEWLFGQRRKKEE